MRGFATGIFAALSALAIASVFAYLTYSAAQTDISTSQYALALVELRSEDAATFFASALDDSLLDTGYSMRGAGSVNSICTNTSLGSYIYNASTFLSDEITTVSASPSVSCTDEAAETGYQITSKIDLSGLASYTVSNPSISKTTDLSLTRYLDYNYTTDCGYKARIRDSTDTTIWQVWTNCP